MTKKDKWMLVGCAIFGTLTSGFLMTVGVQCGRTLERHTKPPCITESAVLEGCDIAATQMEKSLRMCERTLINLGNKDSVVQALYNCAKERKRLEADCTPTE